MTATVTIKMWPQSQSGPNFFLEDLIFYKKLIIYQKIITITIILKIKIS